MTNDEKYEKYKELLAQGMSKQDIGIALGYKGKSAGSSLNKFVKKHIGYPIVTDKKNDKTNNNSSLEPIKQDSLLADDNKGQLQAYFQDLENMEILQRIIEREKTSDDKTRQEEYLLIDEDIFEGDNVRSTIRLDKLVDSDFTKFCKKNKHLANKYHIMSQALREYMNKFE